MAFKHLLRVITMAGLVALGAVHAVAQTSIVGFGDSLMAGYMLAPGQSFPERLEAELRERGHDVVIVNAGVSGDTTSGGLARLDWSVPEDTDFVLLELGANDMLRGISPEVTEANLRQMIERLQERGIGILLIGMLAAPNLGVDFGEAFNAIFPRLAEEYDVEFYPFFLDGVATQAGLLLEDGMHPNAAGVEQMVAGVLPVVEGMLNESAP